MYFNVLDCSNTVMMKLTIEFPVPWLGAQSEKITPDINSMVTKVCGE